MAAQFEQHRENKPRTLAQGKEPALRCFPGAAQALAAAASTLCLVGLARQTEKQVASACAKHVKPTSAWWPASVACPNRITAMIQQQLFDTARRRKHNQRAWEISPATSRIRQSSMLDTRWALVGQSSGLADSLTAA